MKFIIALLSILIQTVCIVNAQNIDSLKQVLKKTDNPEVKVEILLGIYHELKTDSMTAAGKYGIHALIESKNIGNETLIARSSGVVGEIYYDQRKLDSSILHYQVALEYYERSADSLNISRTLSEIGLCYYSNNNLKLAMDYYLRAKKLLERLDAEIDLIDLNNRIVFILIQQEQFEQALVILNHNYNTIRKQPLKPETVKTAFNISNLYKRAKQFELALSYADSTEIFSRQLNFDFGVAKANSMQAYILMDLKKLDEAFQAIESAEKIYKSMDAQIDLFQMAIAKARVHQEKKQFDSMWKAVREAEKRKGQIQDNELLIEYYDADYIANKNTNRYKQALDAHEKLSGIQDSIFKVSNAEKINELQTKYETEKKDGEIATLSQQAQIQALQISQRNTQLIGAGIALLVLILGGFAFNQQRKFKHQQAVSDMEQRMLRLQMNPHFIFNALASIQNYILQSDTKESVSYLAKFGKLMRQILEHSREEFITIEEETDMLRNYLEIQQLRFKNRFDFKIEIDKSIDPAEMKIPPLFAQPFVENAIEHGLKDKTSDGLITIRFSQEGKNIRLEVEDNGSGMSGGMNIQKEHKSLATVITKERLSIFEKKFKQQFLLELASDANGTCAKILLPKI